MFINQFLQNDIKRGINKCVVSLFLFIVTFLTIGCASKKSPMVSGEKLLKRSGEFRLNSDEVRGLGSVIFLETAKNSQLFLYSPFGKKISHLQYEKDSLIVTDSEGGKFKVHSSNPVSLSGLFNFDNLNYGELFTLLSGMVPPFLQVKLNSLEQNGSNRTENDSLFVVKKRGVVKSVNYYTAEYTLTLERGRSELFDNIKLELPHENYFQIRYE